MTSETSWILKKFSTKPYSFLVIDATFASDNPLCFMKNILERILKLIRTVDNKVRDEELQDNIYRDAAKIALSSGKIDKSE